jgi:hypothetical protein
MESEAGKMSLSMKYVSQASGRDLDPEQAEYECEKNRRSERGGGRVCRHIYRSSAYIQEQCIHTGAVHTYRSTAAI